MHCCVMNTLYMRSNGDIPCHDDAGQNIILGRVQTLDKDWSINKVINGPLYESIRRSLRRNDVPWPGVCETCAWFRPHERYSDTLTMKSVRTLQVEPSLACNLKCLCCSQPYQLIERPKPYKMPLDLFESILRSLKSENYQLREIEYCGQGEAMTNPQFSEFVETAREIYPSTLQRLITNGNFDYKRANITAGIDEIMVSCDGARQESYEKYRLGGNLAKTLKFMRDIPRYQSDRRQVVIWKYILFEFNDSDDELIEAQRLAEEINVDLLLFVFTHTLYKSRIYDAATSHMLPLVSSRVRVNSTPIHYQGVRDFVPNVLDGWPLRCPEKNAIFMFDEVLMDGGGGLHLSGWIVSSEAVGLVRFTHNGQRVGESRLNDPRPDVRSAFPEAGEIPGFLFQWKTHDTNPGVHTFGAEVFSEDGHLFMSVTREYGAS